MNPAAFGHARPLLARIRQYRRHCASTSLTFLALPAPTQMPPRAPAPQDPLRTKESQEPFLDVGRTLRARLSPPLRGAAQDSPASHESPARRVVQQVQASPRRSPAYCQARSVGPMTGIVTWRKVAVADDAAGAEGQGQG